MIEAEKIQVGAFASGIATDPPALRAANVRSASALSFAMSAVKVSFAFDVRISRARANPIFSTEPPVLLAFHASNAASLPVSAFQSASVKTIFAPSSGVIATTIAKNTTI